MTDSYEKVLVPGTGGFIRLYVNRRRKFASVTHDLWSLDADLREEACDRLRVRILAFIRDHDMPSRRRVYLIANPDLVNVSAIPIGDIEAYCNVVEDYICPYTLRCLRRH